MYPGSEAVHLPFISKKKCLAIPNGTNDIWLYIKIVYTINLFHKLHNYFLLF